MLIYANSFSINPNGGPKEVINLIAAWVGRPRNSSIDPERLAKGIRELRFSDGAALSSRATLDDEYRAVFPYYFCASLAHNQPEVPGRRWITEVGLRQAKDGDTLECSVLLRTDEISARVNAPIQVTRPKIVWQLMEQCNPIEKTPGLSIIRLHEGNAAAFAYEIEHESRSSPIIQISCDRDGVYPVLPERMRSLTIGLAQTVDIPSGADTYEIQRILGRQYSAFGGAINIIFPVRKTGESSFCRTVLLRPDQIRETQEAGSTIETDVLSIITHHTNLPHSWRHISPDIVGQSILRARLQAAVNATHNSEELAAYEALLQEAADQLLAKDNEIGGLRHDLVDVEANLDQVRAQNEGLKHALSGIQPKSDVEAEQVTHALAPLRESVRSILSGQATLEQALRLVAGLFPTRIVALDTALDSARDSDRSGFIYGNKAFELLMKLAEEYWDALADGNGDQLARTAFGHNSFAAKESESLSNEGKRRRTFNYLGRDIIMEKHIKHGIKDSLAQTLRIHFEWIPDEKKIVIGHCGKHLNF